MAYARQARRYLTHTLHAEIEDGFLNEREALALAARFLYENQFAWLFATRDFSVTKIRNENRWIANVEEIPLVSRVTALGIEVATSFVLRNSKGHELDLHVLQFDNQGNGIAAWNSDFDYLPDAFQGRGLIGDTPVCCLSARMQMLAHTGYELQDKDLQDLRTLHERFAVDYPAEHAHRFV